MRNKLILFGQSDCMKFCTLANECEGAVELVGNGGKYRVNGKSIISCMLAASEWEDIWVETENDCYSAFEPWIEVAADDAAYIHE